MVVTYCYKLKGYYPSSNPIKNGWYGTWSSAALPAVHIVHRLWESSDFDKSTGNPERIKYPRWRTVIWRKEIQSDARAPRLRSKLKFIKIICLNKSDIAECMHSLFLIILFWQLSDPASQCWRARSQPDSLCAVQVCFGGWVGFVGGFSVLSSDCQKRRLFSILDLRNFKSRWTRNLDLIIGPNFLSTCRLYRRGYILQDSASKM